MLLKVGLLYMLQLNVLQICLLCSVLQLQLWANTASYNFSFLFSLHTTLGGRDLLLEWGRNILNMGNHPIMIVIFGKAIWGIQKWACGRMNLGPPEVSYLCSKTFILTNLTAFKNWCQWEVWRALSINIKQGIDDRAYDYVDFKYDEFLWAHHGLRAAHQWKADKTSAGSLALNILCWYETCYQKE